MTSNTLKSTAQEAVAPVAGAVAGAIAGANALPLLGFGSLGIQAGSIAAGIQSTVFGALVPTGSWFATATSWGATGAAAGPLGVAGAIAVGATVYGVQCYLTRQLSAGKKDEVGENSTEKENDGDGEDDHDTMAGKED